MLHASCWVVATIVAPLARGCARMIGAAFATVPHLGRNGVKKRKTELLGCQDEMVSDTTKRKE